MEHGRVDLFDYLLGHVLFHAGRLTRCDASPRQVVGDTSRQRGRTLRASLTQPGRASWPPPTPGPRGQKRRPRSASSPRRRPRRHEHAHRLRVAAGLVDDLVAGERLGQRVAIEEHACAHRADAGLGHREQQRRLGGSVVVGASTVVAGELLLPPQAAMGVTTNTNAKRVVPRWYRARRLTVVTG